MIYLLEKLKRRVIYLVRKRALGDVLWIEPVIRQLAALRNDVVVYTKYPELFCHYPLPNVRFTSRLNLWEKIRWALQNKMAIGHSFVDLEHAYEKDSKKHFLHAYQQAAGVPSTCEYPRLLLTADEETYRPAEAGEGRYVVLHLESLTDRNYRNIFGVEWEKVVSHLAEKGFATVLIGKEPVPVPGARIAPTSIPQMMGTIKNASFFIGIDSGPSHIAAALGTPVLIFFGAVNPEFRHFKSLLKGRILQQPCEYAGWYHEATDATGWSCRLVGDNGIPKCSLFTTEYVLNNIDLLVKGYGL